jgi:hypothetical protein
MFLMIYPEVSRKAGASQAAEKNNYRLIFPERSPSQEGRVPSLSEIKAINAPDSTDSEDFSPANGSLFLIYSAPSEKFPSDIDEAVLDIARHKAIIMKDTLFTQSVLTLTTGVFITGFALKLHASPSVIGFLVALPALAQLLQLPSITLVTRCASLKRLLIQSTLISRLLLLPLAAIPFIPSSSWAIAALVLFYSLYAALAAVATCSWNTWVQNTISPGELGGFFSRKLAFGSLITLGLTFFGGIFIDSGADFCSKIQVPVYSLLFLFAGLWGLYGVLPMQRIRESSLPATSSASAFNPSSPTMLKLLGDAAGMPATAVTSRPQLPSRQVSTWRKLFTPFQEKNYRNLIKFLSIYDFSINLVLPFLTVYMLNSLHYSMGLVSTITIISQIANFLCLPTWGRIADRFSNKSLLMICGPIQLSCIFAWGCFILPGTSAITLPAIIAIHLLLGIGTAGVALANGNIAMKLAPSYKGSPHMACTTMMASLASGVAPLLAGWGCQHLEKSSIALPFLQDSYWYLLFGVACILGIIALVQLGKVEEEGSISKHQLIQTEAFALV